MLSTWTLPKSVKSLTPFPAGFSWRSWLLMPWMDELFAGLKPGWMSRPEHGAEWCYIQLASCHQWCTPGLRTGVPVINNLDKGIRYGGIPSVSSQKPLSWVGLFICWRVEKLCKDFWTGWIDGQRTIL